MIYYKRLAIDQCRNHFTINQLQEDGYVLDDIYDDWLVFKLDTEEVTDKDTLKAAEEEVEDLNGTIEDLELAVEKAEKAKESAMEDYSKAFAVCDRVNRIKWDLRQALNGLDQIDLSDVVESEIP